MYGASFNLIKKPLKKSEHYFVNDSNITFFQHVDFFTQLTEHFD